MGFTLKVTAGPGAGQSLSFDQSEVTFGRTSENDVVLYDPNVSRQHFHIVAQGGGYVLEDLGSSNGTRLNGQGVERQALTDGDQVEAGDVCFVFQAAAARRSGPPARRSRAPSPVAPSSRREVAKGPRGPGASVPARRRQAAAAPMSARERYKVRQAENTPVGRAKAWYGSLAPQKQKIVLAVLGVFGVLLLGGVVSSATGGSVPGMTKDWSDDILELAGPVTTTTFGLGMKNAELARYQLNFRFRYVDGRATLVYDAGWIDSDQEVEIRLNEERIIGYAPMALNTWEETVEIILPHDALIQNDFNTLTFDNTRNPGDGPDETWGIRNVRVIEEPLPEADPDIARERFRLAKDAWEKRRIAPENLAKACREFQLTRDYLERMEVKPPLYDVATTRARDCKKQIDGVWRKLKFSFLKALEFKNYKEAEGLLRQALKYFPDEGDPKNRMIKEKISVFE